MNRKDHTQDSPTKPRHEISRREFARRAALASAAASIAPAAALPEGTNAPAHAGSVAGSAAHGGPASAPASPNKPEAQQPPNTPKLSPESQAEAEARYQGILSQYGKRFTDDQKADLRRLCYVAQAPLDRLRAYNLANGDSPALYLKPLVDREKDPLAGTSKGRTPNPITPRKRV